VNDRMWLDFLKLFISPVESNREQWFSDGFSEWVSRERNRQIAEPTEWYSHYGNSCNVGFGSCSHLFDRSPALIASPSDWNDIFSTQLVVRPTNRETWHNDAFACQRISQIDHHRTGALNVTFASRRCWHICSSADAKGHPNESPCRSKSTARLDIQGRDQCPGPPLAGEIGPKWLQHVNDWLYRFSDRQKETVSPVLQAELYPQGEFMHTICWPESELPLPFQTFKKDLSSSATLVSFANATATQIQQRLQLINHLQQFEVLDLGKWFKLTMKEDPKRFPFFVNQFTLMVFSTIMSLFQ
jgi:hypothetical protein